MTLRRLDQITQFADKRVLVRVDFNVPMQDGRITDDTRLQAALPTIRFIRERCAKVGLLAHFGRPNGKQVPSMSLGPLVGPLSALLEQPVVFANDCIGPDAKVAIDRSPKDIYVSKLPSDSPTTSMVRSSRPETEDSFRHCRSGSSLHSKGWKWRKRGAGASEEEA